MKINAVRVLVIVPRLAGVTFDLHSSFADFGSAHKLLNVCFGIRANELRRKANGLGALGHVMKLNELWKWNQILPNYL